MSAELTTAIAAASDTPDGRSFRVVSIIAAVACIPFVFAHLAFAYLMVPTVLRMFAEMGGELPAITKALAGLASVGLLGPLLLAVDVAIFGLFYRLAKRYWIGLLFVPIGVYLGMGVVLTPLLYLPMYNVVNLVQ